MMANLIYKLNYFTRKPNSINNNNNNNLLLLLPPKQRRRRRQQLQLELELQRQSQCTTSQLNAIRSFFMLAIVISMILLYYLNQTIQVNSELLARPNSRASNVEAAHEQQQQQTFASTAAAAAATTHHPLTSAKLTTTTGEDKSLPTSLSRRPRRRRRQIEEAQGRGRHQDQFPTGPNDLSLGLPLRIPADPRPISMMMMTSSFGPSNKLDGSTSALDGRSSSANASDLEGRLMMSRRPLDSHSSHFYRRSRPPVPVARANIIRIDGAPSSGWAHANPFTSTIAHRGLRHQQQLKQRHRVRAKRLASEKEFIFARPMPASLIVNGESGGAFGWPSLPGVARELLLARLGLAAAATADDDPDELDELGVDEEESADGAEEEASGSYVVAELVRPAAEVAKRSDQRDSRWRRELIGPAVAARDYEIGGRSGGYSNLRQGLDGGGGGGGGGLYLESTRDNDSSSGGDDGYSEPQLPFSPSAPELDGQLPAETVRRQQQQLESAGLASQSRVVNVKPRPADNNGNGNAAADDDDGDREESELRLGPYNGDSANGNSETAQDDPDKSQMRTTTAEDVNMTLSGGGGSSNSNINGNGTGGNGTQSICDEPADLVEEKPSLPARILFFVLYSLVFVIGTVGNALTIYAMLRKSDKNSVIDIFIANLALSDIMLCIFAVPITPIYSLYYGNWVFGTTLCKMFAFAMSSSVYISTFTMINIAFLRYRLIVYPHIMSLTNVAALKLNLCTWILGFIVTFPYVYHVGLLPAENCSIKFCDEQWDQDSHRFWFSIVTLILQFFLPFISVTYFYGSVFWKLHQQREKRQLQQQPPPPSSVMASNHHHHHHHHHPQQIIKLKLATNTNNNHNSPEQPDAHLRATNRQPEMAIELGNCRRNCPDDILVPPEDNLQGHPRRPQKQLLPEPLGSSPLSSMAASSVSIMASVTAPAACGPLGLAAGAETHRRPSSAAGNGSAHLCTSDSGTSDTAPATAQVGQPEAANLKRTLSYAPDLATAGQDHHQPGDGLPIFGGAIGGLGGFGATGGASSMRQLGSAGTETGGSGQLLHQRGQHLLQEACKASSAQAMTGIRGLSNKHHHQVPATASSAISSASDILALREKRLRERNKRHSQTNRKLVFMVALFVGSWLPLNSFNLIQDYQESLSESPYIKHFFLTVHVIACSSVCYNPLLYAWMSDNYRQEMRDIMPSFIIRMCRFFIG